MDDQALTLLLRERRAGRRFWIVVWGDPKGAPDDEGNNFSGPFYDPGLTGDEPEMQIGDIVFVHRMTIGKIMFVGEVMGAPRRCSKQEMRKKWRQRWPWSVPLKNRTPYYGRVWLYIWAKETFEMNKKYNTSYTKVPVSIDALKRGRHVRISRGFANFLIKEIISLH